MDYGPGRSWPIPGSTAGEGPQQTPGGLMGCGSKWISESQRNFFLFLYVYFYFYFFKERQGEREGGREGEEERNIDVREKHQLYNCCFRASFIHPDWGLNPQPNFVP